MDLASNSKINSLSTMVLSASISLFYSESDLSNELWKINKSTKFRGVKV